MPVDSKIRKARAERAKASIEATTARGENYQSIFDKKDDGVKWEKAKSEAIFNAKSASTAPIGHSVSEQDAIAAANNLRSQRRFRNPSTNSVQDPTSSPYIGEKHVGDVPKSELKPLATGEAPKLKNDESLRKATLAGVKERRAGGERRIAMRTDAEPRRKAMVKALADRKGGSVKMKSIGMVGLLASLPSTIGRALELKKAVKGKIKPSLGEGMRTLLDLPQEESSLVKQLRKEGKAKDL